MLSARFTSLLGTSSLVLAWVSGLKTKQKNITLKLDARVLVLLEYIYDIYITEPVPDSEGAL
jgi:hypothetical protein